MITLIFLPFSETKPFVGGLFEALKTKTYAVPLPVINNSGGTPPQPPPAANVPVKVETRKSSRSDEVIEIDILYPSTVAPK